ncbi:YmgD family protein, partial [Escherichia coli]|nr:YmgD family protein [Escherichia coli]MEA0013898.1 YmgD family protein [Escherichia coli]
GGTADRNRSHWSTSKTPSYTKSVSWQHHPCAEANEMAKTDSAQVAEIVAVMGNASVASRDLKIEQSPELSAKVVEKLNQVCAKDPQMLLITAIDDTMRAIGKK